MGWVINDTPRPPYPRVRPSIIVYEAGWASGQVETGAENLAPSGIRSPDRPARSHWWRSLVHCPIYPLAEQGSFISRKVRISWDISWHVSYFTSPLSTICKDRSVDRRIVLIWILNKRWDVGAWFIWLSIRTSGDIFWTQWWLFGFNKTWAIYWEAKGILCSRKGIYSMEFGSAGKDRNFKIISNTPWMYLIN